MWWIRYPGIAQILHVAQILRVMAHELGLVGS